MDCSLHRCREALGAGWLRYITAVPSVLLTESTEDGKLLLIKVITANLSESGTQNVKAWVCLTCSAMVRLGRRAEVPGGAVDLSELGSGARESMGSW